MRVLHITDHYPPALGGIETHVATLAERQARGGHEVSVLTSTPSTADGRHSDDSGLVTVRRARSLTARAGVDVATYDVVHAHLSVVAPFSAPLAAAVARSGVPTVVTVHSLWSRMGPIPAVAAQLAGLRRAPVLWTAVSGVAASELARHLPPRAVVDLLSNAVDVPARSGEPEPAHGRPVRLVSTMRIARRKRPVALLRMFASLKAAVDVPVELVIVGDGPLRSRVERAADRAGLGSDVTVTGRLEPAHVFTQLAASDVYMAPATLESFGLAALEARSVGLPVVGRAGTGLAEFVRDGLEGLLCQSDADMVRSLARLVLDDELRRRISEHNRTVASVKTWADTLQAHEDVYERARTRSAPAVADAERLGARRR